MGMKSSLSRRQALRGGALALAGGVGAAALAACGEEKVVTKEVIKEVPVQTIVTQEVIKEVEVATIVTQEVIKEVPVQQIVEKEVIREVIVEKIVEKARERAPGVDAHLLSKIVDIGGEPWDPIVGGEVSYFTFTNPNSLDPLSWITRGPEATSPMFERLVVFGEDNVLQPHLAADLPQVADDHMSWTLPLRNDVKFHDGTPFNADAVVFNFERYLDDSAVRGSVAGEVGAFANVEKIDDFTVRFNTNGPQPLLPEFLTTASLVMGSPKAITEMGQDFERNPVGTGPYSFVSWTDDVDLLYERFDDYNWGPPFATNKGPGLADTARILQLSMDFAARAQAFEAGEIDISLQFTFPDVQRVSENPAFHVIGLLFNDIQYVPMNVIKWPLTDINVRKALIHALDRRTATVRQNGGLAPTLVSNLLAPGTIGFSEEASKLYDWNVPKANQILDEAGYARGEDGFRYDSEGKRLEVIFPNTPNPICELFKLDIESNIGIFVDVPNIDFPTFAEGMSQGLYHHAWNGVGGRNGDALYTRFHTSLLGKPGRAWTFFEYSGEPGVPNPDSRIDPLLDGARTEFDAEKRVQMWKDAEYLLMQNAVGVPLVQSLLAWLTNPQTVGGRMFIGSGASHPYFGDLYSKD
ncbi:MAG: ABC transporter substrate-binding protein [Chloroflexota bacterium]|nr:ABC transporter substrate-binding protein [Chloroflexota bacterium]